MNSIRNIGVQFQQSKNLTRIQSILVLRTKPRILNFVAITWQNFFKFFRKFLIRTKFDKYVEFVEVTRILKNFLAFCWWTKPFTLVFMILFDSIFKKIAVLLWLCFVFENLTRNHYSQKKSNNLILTIFRKSLTFSPEDENPNVQYIRSVNFTYFNNFYKFFIFI
jgi:hypothetical protein